MKAIKGFRIIYHGVDASQYFPGHGISGTPYTDTATGCGVTPAEALADALDSLAQNDWDVGSVEGSAEGKTILTDHTTVAEAIGEEPGENSELYFYVSVDVR